MSRNISVLVIDDDPDHLKIYGWILKAAGFHAVTAQVTPVRVFLPPEGMVDAIVLDYRLVGSVTAVDAARQARQRYPDAPIIILSDLYDMPTNIAPFARTFVHKGDPDKLIAAIRALLPEETAVQADEVS
ncbi:MAG TPA: response regulator [Acidobacteriaceae bacterium]|nr:response regulator [Acidobacteriaceae bacterium]